MRVRFKREIFADRFTSMWRRTDRLFDIVARDAMLSRPIPLRHSFIFYAGHLPAFAWNHASGATDMTLLRRSFRNWYQARYPYVFAKFRCIRPGRD